MPPIPSPISALFRYSVKVEYLFTWYPIGDTPNLRQPRMLGDSFSRNTTNFESQGIGAGVRETVTVGLGWSGDAFDEADSMGAFIDLGVRSNLGTPVFDATIIAKAGVAAAQQEIVIPPGAAVPVMVNVKPKASDRRLTGTAGVLQAVFRAGDRPTFLLPRMPLLP